MNNSNDEKLLEIIEAFIKVKEGKIKKQSLKKRFGIGAKGYDEMRLNLIKSNHLIHPLAIYTQEEINKLIEGNKELEKLFDDKAKEVENHNEKYKNNHNFLENQNRYIKSGIPKNFAKWIEKKGISKKDFINKWKDFKSNKKYTIFSRLTDKLRKEGKSINEFISKNEVINDIKNLIYGEINKYDFYDKYLLTPSEFKNLRISYFCEICNADFKKCLHIYPLEYMYSEDNFRSDKQKLGITKKSEVKLELLNNPNIKKEDLINEFILAKDDYKILFSLIDKYNLSYFLFNCYREHFVKHEGINPRKLYHDINIKGVKWLEKIVIKNGEVLSSEYKPRNPYFEEGEEFLNIHYPKRNQVKEYQIQSEGEEPMKQQKQKKNNSTKKELNNKPKEGEKTMSKSSKLQAIQAINQDTPMNTNITKEQKEELVEKGIYDNKQEEAEAKALKEISENLKEVKEEVKALKEEKEKTKEPSKAGRPKWKNEKEKKTAKTLIYTTQELKDKILKYSEKAKEEGLIASQTGAMSEYITLILEKHFAELEKK